MKPRTPLPPTSSWGMKPRICRVPTARPSATRGCGRWPSTCASGCSPIHLRSLLRPPVAIPWYNQRSGRSPQAAAWGPSGPVRRCGSSIAHGLAGAGPPDGAPAVPSNDLQDVEDVFDLALRLLHCAVELITFARGSSHPDGVAFLGRYQLLYDSLTEHHHRPTSAV